MRTITQVHSPQERLRMRQLGNRRARVHQVQLLCVVSLLRTLAADVLPLCGSACWWLAPVCLLPGVVLYALACAVLKRTGTATLTEAARALLGKAGATVLSLLLSLLLLAEGAATMTALVTGFTEGIGTEGTQLTMAALTLLALLFCLHRDGLAWGIHLMRWPMLALAAGAAGVLMTLARADGLHPIGGPGQSAVISALRSGLRMGWPLVLLATLEPARPGWLRPLLPPVVLLGAAALLICLTQPCEVLTRPAGLAEHLLLPALHLPPALRTLTHALMMLAAFLTVATAAQLSAMHGLSPWGRDVNWLPGVLAGVMAATQALPIRPLWQALTGMLDWLAAALFIIVVWMVCRRKACAGK
ncbi:MAG: hypothetical protein ACI4MJ_01470 [Aristaeellaceae bacterium]